MDIPYTNAGSALDGTSRIDDHRTDTEPSCDEFAGHCAKPPPSRPPGLIQVAVDHFRQHWFEWLFVAILGLLIAMLNWKSDHKLGILVELAERWDRVLQQAPEVRVDSVATAPSIHPVKITGISPRPGSPAEVRITGLGPRPPHHVYAAVRTEGAADQKIGGEASYDGEAKWTAVMHLNYDACRNDASGLDRDHLVYLLSLREYPETDPVMIGSPVSVVGSDEVEYDLKC